MRREPLRDHPLGSVGLTIVLIALATVPAAAEVEVFLMPKPPHLQPVAITLGPDGNMWFVDFSSSAIGRITPEGEVTSFGTPRALAAPQAIVAGVDGRMWVTFPNKGEHAHAILAVSAEEATLGEMTLYDLPTVGAGPMGAALGPAGAVWFTEAQYNNIAWISPFGDIVEYHLEADAVRGFMGIALGADDAMWFTQSQPPARIGRIDPLGEITEYDLPTPDSAPGAIAADAAGNLWITHAGAAMITRMTPAGKATEFPLAAPAAGAAAVLAGPDGSMYFSQFSEPEEGDGEPSIARIGSTGAIADYPLPPPVELVAGLAFDADGDLWFTDPIARLIGRLRLSTLELDPPVAPSGLVATAISDSTVDLSWVDRSDDEERFTVQMSRGGDGFLSEVASLPAGSTSTTVDHLEAGITYTFRVRAHNAAWASPVSNEASATPGGGEEGGGPEPPAGAWLSSPALPGFEAKVRVTAGATTIDGGRVDDCIVNTLCVSGAVAGQPEVFLRVAGPKPNGMLWPTLVKFSTSQIEVWVRQLDGGATNYYLLPAVAPGGDLLDLAGLADKQGFDPAGTASGASFAAHGLAGRSAPAAGGPLAVRPAATGPPPPAGDWLATEALPGFRAKVRITSGSSLRDGAGVEDCIVNTLCVSGAVAGQPEVFIRVAGPKPNGMLWPTLVKFSTSQLEVWIEQAATGLRQYYRLDAVGAGGDVLDLAGLADKQGFEPAP